ncbi:MAG: hypothetical protein JWQ09_2104 [Segetibacter sp.]|nr:hypothetical protein [Segetibacter sp.]
MKKILIVVLLAAYSHISSAQSSEEIVSSNIDTAPVATKIVSLEERMNKQEQEIQVLKRDNETLKKQMSQLRRSLPNAKRKFSVSRVGSKQVIAE